jgi:hypothetical protein
LREISKGRLAILEATIPGLEEVYPRKIFSGWKPTSIIFFISIFDFPIMAVPKKKRSRTKKAKRRYQWRLVARKAAERAISLSAVSLKRNALEQADAGTVKPEA